VKKDKIPILLATLSLAGAVVAYFFLPDSIPMHWNIAGEIDSWGPRASIFGLGALPLACALLFRWLPRIDPNRGSYARHAKTFEILQLILVLGLAALVWVSIAVALGLPMDVGVVIRSLVGVLFIGMGNFMGRLKRNYFVGIKTPWALADDEVWRLTHRRGGVVFVAMGAVYLLSLLIPSGRALEAVIAASTLGGIAYTFLYSYLAWRRVKGEDRKPEASE
jgi:uncharacterized membrane protein